MRGDEVLYESEWDVVLAGSDDGSVLLAVENADGYSRLVLIDGEEIPLPARITSVADVYDALTTARPYKQPYSHDVAVNIIRSGRETQFDPAIVDAFMEREEAFATLAASMTDPSNPGESPAPELLATAAC